MRKLLEKLAGLKKRAADKQAEIKDDMSPEAIRKIETEHGEIMAEITAVNAAIRALEESAEDSEDDPAPTPSADASARAADILSIGTRAGMETTAIETAIRDSRVTVDAFRTQAFEALAARSSANPTNPARVIRDEAETLRANLTEALSYRMGTPTPQAGVSEGARQFMEFGLIDVAARCIDYRPGSMSLSVRQIEDIFTRASHTTSDFPIIFEGSINRALEGRYALAQPTYRRIARKRNFRDFRPHTTVKLGDFPQLKKVLEDGEIKYGTFNEGKETVQAFSYAIALSVTRQMLINDELDAISDLLSSYGASVALFEEITFYASAFNGVLADTKTVFHADHNNLAGAGTVIDVDNVLHRGTQEYHLRGGRGSGGRGSLGSGGRGRGQRGLPDGRGRGRRVFSVREGREEQEGAEEAEERKEWTHGYLAVVIELADTYLAEVKALRAERCWRRLMKNPSKRARGASCAIHVWPCMMALAWSAGVVSCPAASREAVLIG